MPLTSSTRDPVESAGYVIPTRFDRPSSTEREEPNQQGDLLARRGRSTTDAERAVRGSVLVKSVNTPFVQAGPIAQPEGAARGVVLSFDDVAVRCEFLHGDAPQVVWLPRSLFPDALRVGWPFSFALMTENGRKTPRVANREPVQDLATEERTAGLVARFRA